MTPTGDDARTRWDKRYAASPAELEPAAFLDDIADLLPPSGSVVDVGGGSGRNARWFAARGFDVTVVDVSPTALALVSGSSEGRDIECVERDVETSGMPPGRTWDVALMHLFFDRALFLGLAGSVNPGGLVLVAQPTVSNLERHERPGRRFLLELGELGELVAQLPELEVVELTERWEDTDRHEARLIARRLGLG